MTHTVIMLVGAQNIKKLDVMLVVCYFIIIVNKNLRGWGEGVGIL